MKFNFPVNNFSSGEWSPKMRSRTDTQEYLRSCEELTNMLPQMQGGVQYRSGTRYRDLGDNILQTQLDNILATDLYAGKIKLVSYQPLNGFSAILAILPGATWITLPLGAAVTYGANTTTTTWSPANTQVTQVGDILILADGLGLNKPKVFYYDPATLAYVLKDIVGDYITSKPWITIPFDRIEALDSNVTMSVPAITNTVGSTFTVTASASYFNTNMTGAYLRLCNGTALDGVVQLTTFGSATTFTVTIRQILPNASFVYGSTTNNNSFWQISMWRNDSGWPRTVVAFQGRIIYGGTKTKPDSIFGSRISSYFDMCEVPSPNTTGVTGFASSAFTADNSRPFTLTPNTSEASNIVAMSAAKTLNIHTDKSEIVAYGSNGALGPVNCVFSSSTSFGGEAVQPTRVNNYSTFVQKGGIKIRDVIYSFDEDQYKSTDLGFVADHMFMSPDTSQGVDTIVSLTRWETRSSMLMCQTQRGKLYAVTLDRDYQITAWSRILLGSSVAPGEYVPYDRRTYPFIVSICTYPGEGTGGQALWMVVARQEVDDSIHFSLEWIPSPFELQNPFLTGGSLTGGTSGDAYPRYLDLSTVCVPESPFIWRTYGNGLSPGRYVFRPVSVVADGNYIGEFIPDVDGKLTFTKEYDSVYVGFKYPGVVKTSPIEQGGQFGVPVGRIKKIDEMVVRFHNSIGCLYGRDADNLFDIPMRESSQPMNESVKYFSGDAVVNFPAGYERACQVIIKQDKPYPLYILSVTPRGVTYD